VLLDADSFKLRKMKNANDQTPVELGHPKYEDFLITIWDRVKQGNHLKIREYVMNNKEYGGKLYHINI
jgi:hypothetical protein